MYIVTHVDSVTNKYRPSVDARLWEYCTLYTLCTEISYVCSMEVEARAFRRFILPKSPELGFVRTRQEQDTERLERFQTQRV